MCKRWVFSDNRLGFPFEAGVITRIENPTTAAGLHHQRNWRFPAGSQLVSSWRSQNVWAGDYTEGGGRGNLLDDYLSGWKMGKCRGKVHWATLIWDNFQVMPHLIADASRYWLPAFWKSVTEPCRGLVSVEASQTPQATWEQWCGLDRVYLILLWKLPVC